MVLSWFNLGVTELIRSILFPAKHKLLWKALTNRSQGAEKGVTWFMIVQGAETNPEAWLGGGSKEDGWLISSGGIS